jgi:hypothetical protein
VHEKAMRDSFVRFSYIQWEKIRHVDGIELIELIVSLGYLLNMVLMFEEDV